MDLRKFIYYVSVAVTIFLVSFALNLWSTSLIQSFFYLFLGISSGILSYLQYKKLEKIKLLAKLRSNWGIFIEEKERDFSKIRFLFQEEAAELSIDDRTWGDLNMDLVFARIDRTLTWPGLQTLYSILRSPKIDDLTGLKKRQEIIDIFQKDQGLREEIQLLFKKVDARLGSGLALMIWQTPIIDPIHPRIIYVILALLALFSPLMLLISFKYLLLVILIFQLNLYFHFRVQREIRPYFEGVRSLGQLISISEDVRKIESEPLQHLLDEIASSYHEVKKFRSIMKFVGTEVKDPLVDSFQQYYTIFFLAEVRGFYKSLQFIKDNQAQLKKLYLAIGELDALQSVASFRESLAYYSTPEFISEKSFELNSAYYPLIAEPVPNSIRLAKKDILITGSNMSGKSTFLRTVGVNVLLAQTIGTCLAKKYIACPVRLISSIGREDNVVEGKSYYLEEALGILRILEALDEKVVTLAIFDELYRGTNSEERIFAARRVLEYLGKRNSFVFVATHDLELVDMLGEQYESVHFSEQVGEVGLEFDYQLKKGPATTKNAIALLRYLNYPKEITD